MKKSLFKFKTLSLITAIIFCMLQNVQAQHTKVIGNKPATGTSNNSFIVVKGDQVGIKMNAGQKPVQLLKFNFDVSNRHSDSAQFKVNIYTFIDDVPGKNLVKQDIYGTIHKGENAVSIDLEPYQIKLSGNILVTIEWLKTTNNELYFPCGLFNGGTYYYENNLWKKIPVAGADFNLLVMKL